ncbi:proteasome regulatory particle base subunit, partial [Serendipita sp. 399]
MPVELPVAPIPSEDPKKKKEKNEADRNGEGLDDKAKAKDKTDEEELSEEDQALKNELEMLVERLQEPDKRLYRPALEALRTLIRTSTSSMTSVPKPLKFLRPVYPSLQELYETWDPSSEKALFAEILSVLAMTYSDTQPRGTLKYRLLSDEITGGGKSDPGLWGHEYVRHIAAELGTEYVARKEANEQVEDLIALAVTCAKFLLRHNAEADAVDLLEELESIGAIVKLVDSNTFSRVCLYMVSCVNFLAPPDDVTFLETAHTLYVKYGKFPEALALSIRLYNQDLIRADFEAAANPAMKRQLAFMIARAGIPLEWVIDTSEGAEEIEEDLLECLSNAKLSTHFRAFGKDVGALEPKSLEDIYKSHLEQTRLPSATGGDSARANLAGTFVNAFVNAGFSNDPLMAKAAAGDSWVYKNKDHGVTSAAASLGMCVLWDTAEGLGEVDKYTYLSDEKIKAGALMATGMLFCNTRDENEAVVALLEEPLTEGSAVLKRCAIVG